MRLCSVMGAAVWQPGRAEGQRLPSAAGPRLPARCPRLLKTNLRPASAQVNPRTRIKELTIKHCVLEHFFIFPEGLPLLPPAPSAMAPHVLRGHRGRSEAGSGTGTGTGAGPRPQPQPSRPAAAPSPRPLCPWRRRAGPRDGDPGPCRALCGPCPALFRRQPGVPCPLPAAEREENAAFSSPHVISPSPLTGAKVKGTGGGLPVARGAARARRSPPFLPRPLQEPEEGGGPRWLGVEGGVLSKGGMVKVTNAAISSRHTGRDSLSTTMRNKVLSSSSR